MTFTELPLPDLLIWLVIIVVGGVVGLLLYIGLKYAPIVARVFAEPPVFAPLRGVPVAGEDVRFRTADGLELAGTYLPRLTPRRLGVIVFCPEFLGDRWSALSYGEGLREAGFDLFAFDFRNHGDSAIDATYRPLQWVSDLELLDLRAALAYVRSRDDADPAGVGLFGVSRGGGTALCLAAEDPGVWGVVTDGAFPTRGTMRAYVGRWAEIYLPRRWMARVMPGWLFDFAGWTGRIVTQKRLGRRYPSLERAAAAIAPRPWLMIHGERDVYIGPEIALGLFAFAGQPKEAWIVSGAKHNRCREAAPEAYQDRIVRFFARFAPRCSSQPEGSETSAGGRSPEPVALAGATSVSGLHLADVAS